MGLVRLVRGDISKLQWDPWKHLRLAEVSCLEAVQPVKLELCTGEWALEHWLSLMYMQRPWGFEVLRDTPALLHVLETLAQRVFISGHCGKDGQGQYREIPRLLTLTVRCFWGQSTWVHTDGCNTAPTGRDVLKNLLSLSLSVFIALYLSISLLHVVLDNQSINWWRQQVDLCQIMVCDHGSSNLFGSGRVFVFKFKSLSGTLECLDILTHTLTALTKTPWSCCGG